MPVFCSLAFIHLYCFIFYSCRETRAAGGSDPCSVPVSGGVAVLSDVLPSSGFCCCWEQCLLSRCAPSAQWTRKVLLFRLWLLWKLRSSEGRGGMMVNLIFKGKASATDFCVCQFLDESNFHVSWRSLSKRLCTRFWPIAVNFWTAPFATHSQVNLVIGTDNYKQHVIAAVLLSLLYSGNQRNQPVQRWGTGWCSAPEETETVQPGCRGS